MPSKDFIWVGSFDSAMLQFQGGPKAGILWSKKVQQMAFIKTCQLFLTSVANLAMPGTASWCAAGQQNQGHRAPAESRPKSIMLLRAIFGLHGPEDP